MRNLNFIAMLWMIFALGQMKNGQVGMAWTLASFAVAAFIVQMILDGIDEDRQRKR